MIINSILDTDLYKLTMQAAVLATQPNLKVKYRFYDRNGIKYPKGFAQELVFEVSKMSELCLTDQEADFIRNLELFPPYYIAFLRSYRFDSSELHISQDKAGRLVIDIEGYWYRTILWEVPLMALISELYFRETEKEIDIHKNENKDKKKAELLAGCKVADFGTRRRVSRANQERMVTLLKNNLDTFVGTSNVKIAMDEGLKCIGTMAHEWIMVYAALYGYKMANRMALDAWTDVYGGDLGIALSDTFTTEVFFKSFDTRLSKLFDGVRHDSGDPIKFADKVIDHYKKLNIDPITKTIVFSDGLNPDLAVVIQNYCKDKIKCSFGIGTNFTNDIGLKPLNIVIKVSDVWIDGEWYPCVKLSDNEGKNTGDTKEVKLCKGILRI